MTNLDQILKEPFELTPQHIDFYQKNGFIKLKQVLDEETLDFFNAEITKVVHEKNPLLKKPIEERNVFEQAFIQIGNLWRTNDLIKKMVLSKRLGKIAADLMKVDGVRLYHDQALYKEPGKKVKNITPWHADQYYWPLDTDNTITAWIPLQKTTPEMGPLAFSMESQKHDFGRNLEISEESEVKIQKALSDANLALVDEGFDAGEISFHGGWTFHRASANVSDKVRAVMTIIYMEDGIKEMCIRDRDNAPLPPYVFPDDIPVVRHYHEETILTAKFPDNLNWKSYWAKMVDTYREACDIAANYNLSYQMHPAHGVLSATTDAFLYFHDAVGRDNLRFNFDTANQYFLKDNLQLSLHRLADFIDYIHISDNRGGKVEHLAIGDGVIRWDDFFETLEKIGFKGHYGIDIGGAESSVEDLDKAYKKAAEFLGKKIKGMEAT